MPKSFRSRCYWLSARLALGLLLCAHPLSAQTAPHTLSGVVTDAHHEPLRGAVVTLENEVTESVVTYLTDRSGAYVFKHVNDATDYRFWATYRGTRSRTKHISQFSSKVSPTVNLVIKLP